jgi:hypothetical protein
MITAGQIAAELRRIADVLDKEPETELVQPRLGFYHGYGATKEPFRSLARIFPRPFKKGEGYDHDQITLTHETPALEVYAAIDRSKVCVLESPAIPAKYRCEPLLSEAEEESVTA